jgi:hypothetical protein
VSKQGHTGKGFPGDYPQCRLPARRAGGENRIQKLPIHGRNFHPGSKTERFNRLSAIKILSKMI